ncbi:hypothetical protein GSI_03946 [Ganoderma sinense ZZ0214-1]|uniref:F-box domain-containing protein n=1 Tax=Ganoderma sinense ZZ0214-1 TaxID=1077348 RepID=A0A2G8SKD2_9APHY|nr:hypothetical protein GSI_03946 [Ganoderma sinense ZZ0214-1]
MSDNASAATTEADISSSFSPPASWKRPNDRLRYELRALAPYLAGLGDPRAPAFTTSARCVFEPTGSISQLPVELIREIVLLADPAALPILCLVNKIFKELAETRLYKDLEFPDDSHLKRCFKTLSDRPELSKHPRRVVMRQAHHPEDLRDAYNTLRGMHNLTSLHLEFIGSIGSHLQGSKFRLTFLVIVCDWDLAFVEWLAEQMELRSFVFWGLPEPGIDLDDSALPKLSHVVGAASLACALVPGRPVREVLISYATLNPALEPAIEFVWQRCAQSTGPLEIVNVGSAIQDMDARDLMALLQPIPDLISDLVLFNVQVLKGNINKAACDDLSTILSKMKKLEALFVYSRPPGDYVGDRNNHREIVISFAQQCPTLRSITLTHDIWTYCEIAPDKWITVDDVSKLLEDFRARCSPQDLQLRSAKLQAHRAAGGSTSRHASLSCGGLDLEMLLSGSRGRGTPGKPKASVVGAYAPQDYTAQLANDDTVESLATAYKAASSLLRSISASTLSGQ